MKNEIELTDIKQIAYLNMCGINFKRFVRKGNKKIFYYENSSLIDEKIKDFYNSDISRFLGCYENIKTLVYRT